jgi:hypothetical protein
MYDTDTLRAFREYVGHGFVAVSYRRHTFIRHTPEGAKRRAHAKTKPRGGGGRILIVIIIDLLVYVLYIRY